MSVVKKRFGTVTVLSGNTRILGATAAEWDKALTGNMRNTLADVKRRADSGVKKDVSKAKSFDVATIAGKRLRSL